MSTRIYRAMGSQYARLSLNMLKASNYLKICNSEHITFWNLDFEEGFGVVCHLVALAWCVCACVAPLFVQPVSCRPPLSSVVLQLALGPWLGEFVKECFLNLFSSHNQNARGVGEGQTVIQDYNQQARQPATEAGRQQTCSILESGPTC